jgi:hypothetical protein
VKLAPKIAFDFVEELCGIAVARTNRVRHPAPWQS